MKKNKIKKLYRIFNLNKGEYGEPFALCDKCFKKWEEEIRGKIVYERIANDTSIPCNQCNKKKIKTNNLELEEILNDFNIELLAKGGKLNDYDKAVDRAKKLILNREKKQREEIVEMVKGLKIEIKEDEDKFERSTREDISLSGALGYNKAIEEVLKLIKNYLKLTKN